jgi:hypothetical protein
MIRRDPAMGIGTPVRGPRRCGRCGGSPGLIAPRGVVKRETDRRVRGDSGHPRDAGHVARDQHGGPPSARSARLEVRGPPGLMDFPPDASHSTGDPGRGGEQRSDWPRDSRPGRPYRRVARVEGVLDPDRSPPLVDACTRSPATVRSSPRRHGVRIRSDAIPPRRGPQPTLPSVAAIADRRAVEGPRPGDFQPSRRPLAL